MAKPSLNDLVREYLEEAQLMQIVSAVDNQPWLAHVWFAADSSMSLYWMSREDRRHSQEIRKQAKASAGIAVPHTEGLGQKVRGLICQGRAEELAGESLREGYAAYEERWPSVSDHVGIEDLLGNSSRMRFYALRPTMIVLFDEVNFPDQPRQELFLS